MTETNIELPKNETEINSLEKIQSLGFEGSDLSTSISLFEYGLAWLKGETETLFIYGVAIDEGEWVKFDRCSVPNDLDIVEEYGWADFKECIYDDSASLGHRMSDLLSHYGFENIFGAPYTPGFEIENILS